MKRRISTIVAGVFCGLSAQVGTTAAATDTSAASSSQALRGGVVIRCHGTVRTMPPGPKVGGRCTVTGAITDRGKFVDHDRFRVHPHVRTLFLAKGTIGMSVYRERRGHWRIIDGTGAYAGLRGRGREALSGECPRGPLGPLGCAISFTMTGTVSQSTGTATTGSALQGEVRIHALGTRLGTDQSGAAEGRFTISGAITDKGRFVDKVRLNVGYVRTLFGAKGTIEITFAGSTPNWRVAKGTRAYTGLRGWGRERRLQTPTSIDATMIGTVWR